MLSRLGSNVQIWSLDDWGNTLSFWKGFHPTAMVATINNLNDANRIREMRDAMPGTIIVARYIVTVLDDKGKPKEIDGAFHTKPEAAGDTNYYLVSPENFLNLIKPLALGERIVLYVMNEPSGEVDAVTFDRLVKWLVEVIRLADERGWSLCIANWGVGHPVLIKNRTELDGRLDPVLMAIANAKMKHYWGLHLYAPVDTLQALVALEGSCTRLQIKPPQTIVTELGFDTANDGTGLDSYTSRDISGTAFGRWKADLIKNKLRHFFEAGWLVALIDFCWGGRPRWEGDDTQRDSGYKQTITEAYTNGELTVTSKLQTATIPKYYPSIAPANLDFPLLYKVGLPNGISYRNIRVLPEEASDDTSKIYDAETVRIWDSPRAQDNLMRNWRWCEVVIGVNVGQKGWLYIDGIKLTLAMPATTTIVSDAAAALPDAIVLPDTDPQLVAPVVPDVATTPPAVETQPAVSTEPVVALVATSAPPPPPKSRDQLILEQLKVIRGALDALITLYEAKPVQA